MTYDKVMKLAEEIFDEEYSGLDKDSFLIGFQEAYNALTALYKDKFELVKQMRKAQKQWQDGDPFDGSEMELAKRMRENESKVDEYLKKMEV